MLSTNHISRKILMYIKINGLLCIDNNDNDVTNNENVI